MNLQQIHRFLHQPPGVSALCPTRRALLCTKLRDRWEELRWEPGLAARSSPRASPSPCHASAERGCLGADAEGLPLVPDAG